MIQTKSILPKISSLPNPSVRSFVTLSLILIGLNFLFSGCNTMQVDDLENGEANEIEKQSEAGIADDGLIISFLEVMGDSIPELRLEMKTVRIMPCINYFIRMSLQDEFDDNVLTRYLSLKEIDRASVCFTALGPAVARVPFQDLKNKVSIFIQDGDYKDNIQVYITADKVEILSKETGFIELEFDRYFRKPEQSFYFRCGTMEESAHLCEDFHNILLSELQVEPFQFPAEGYIPYPKSSSGNVVNHPTRFYLYQNENQFEQAGKLLEDFTREKIAAREGISMSIINWVGKGYRSWQVDQD